MTRAYRVNLNVLALVALFTGGLLAPFYANRDIGVLMTSEASTFTWA